MADEIDLKIELTTNAEVRLEHHHSDGNVEMTPSDDDWIVSPDLPGGGFSGHGWSRREYTCPACGTVVTADVTVDVAHKID